VQFAAAATPASSATIGFDQAAKYLRIRDSWQLEIVSRSLQLGTSCLQLATRNSKLAVRNPPKKRTLIASAARLCRRFCDIDSDFAFSLQPTSSTCGSQSSVDSRQSPELVEFSSQFAVAVPLSFSQLPGVILRHRLCRAGPFAFQLRARFPARDPLADRNFNSVNGKTVKEKNSFQFGGLSVTQKINNRNKSV